MVHLITPRYGPGTRVALRSRLKRGRRHKRGPVNLRRGTRAVVVARRRGWVREARYDLTVPRGYGELLVRSVPGAKVRRRLPAGVVEAGMVLGVAALLALLVLLG